MWAMEKAIEVGLEIFKESDRFTAYFKQEYKIKIRKVIHLATRSNVFAALSPRTFKNWSIVDPFRIIMQEKQ